MKYIIVLSFVIQNFVHSSICQPKPEMIPTKDYVENDICKDHLIRRYLTSKICKSSRPCFSCNFNHIRIENFGAEIPKSTCSATINTRNSSQNYFNIFLLYSVVLTLNNIIFLSIQLMFNQKFLMKSHLNIRN